MFYLNVDRLNFSARAANFLKKNNITNIVEMAMINYEECEGGGKKTVEEIKAKINELADKGYYSNYIVDKYVKGDVKSSFVSSLNLSNKAKNVLDSLNIVNSCQFFSITEDYLWSVRGVGEKTVLEIMNYISHNRDIIIASEEESLKNVFVFPVNEVYLLCAETSIKELMISNVLQMFLYKNGIYNVYDLINIKIKYFDNPIFEEYEYLYNFFWNFAYRNSSDVKLSSSIKKSWVVLPFDLADFYKSGQLVLVNELLKCVLDNFVTFNRREKLNIKIFLFWLNSLKINDVAEYFLNFIDTDDKEFYVFSQRAYRTLEDVGNELGLTRERVRQLETRFFESFQPKYELFPFKRVLSNDIYEVSNCTLSELFFLNLDAYTEHQFYKVHIDSEIYFYDKKILTELSYFLEEKQYELSYNGFLEYNFVGNYKLFEQAIDQLNLRFHNGKIFKRTSKRQMTRYAMRYANKPISISNEADLQDLLDIIYNLFGERWENNRAFQAIVTDAGVRIDSGTYVADDKVIPLPKDILNDIIKYIRKKEIINSRDLFIDFGDVLTEHNLNNDVILYRYLKENLEGQVYFHGVSAVISSNSDLTCWGDVVIRDIRITGKPINKLDFMVKYSITDAVYVNLPINFSDIIVWSSKELYLKSMLKVSENEMINIANYIKERQIVSFGEVKKYLLSLSSDFLTRNCVVNNDNFYYFMSNILSDDFVVDKNSEEVRIIIKDNYVIEEVKLDSSIDELTL